MRVALVSPAYVPAVDFGGPVETIRGLSGALRALGVDARVITSDLGPGQSRVAAGERDVDGVPVTYVRRLGRFRWSPFAPSAWRHVTRSPPDVAHLFGFRDGVTLPAAAALYRRGIPYVLEPCGMVTRRGRSLLLKRLVDASVADRVLRGAAVVVAKSPQEAAELAERVDPRRVVVRPTPLRTRRQRTVALSDSGRLRVAFVGRVAPVKNLGLLVDAVHRVDRVDVDIIGPVEDRRTEALIRAAVDEHRLHDRVRLVGPLYDEALDAHLDLVDCVVLPSTVESFGNAAVEAAAAGFPVIVSRTVGAADLLSRSGSALVFDPHDVDDLAAQLTALRDDLSSRTRLAAGAAAVRAQTSPEGVARQQLAIYERALAR